LENWLQKAVQNGVLAVSSGSQDTKDANDALHYLYGLKRLRLMLSRPTRRTSIYMAVGPVGSATSSGYSTSQSIAPQHLRLGPDGYSILIC
jgi:glycine betaine/choline ABC-type transport system substrate-binding protein